VWIVGESKNLYSNKRRLISPFTMQFDKSRYNLQFGRLIDETIDHVIVALANNFLLPLKFPCSRSLAFSGWKFLARGDENIFHVEIKMKISLLTRSCAEKQFIAFSNSEFAREKKLTADGAMKEL
jgi:hypothetical protein